MIEALIVLKENIFFSKLMMSISFFI